MTPTRRDPRAELAARHVPASRPRFTIEPHATPPGRPRRDPRAERRAVLVPGTAPPRLDRTGGGAAPLVAANAPAAPRHLAEAPNPHLTVLVVPDAPAGRPTRHDLQLLAAARRLADPHGAAVVLAGGANTDSASLEALADAGADRLIPIAQQPQARAPAIAALIDTLAPIAVLFPETPDGGDLARRVAALRHEPLATHLVALTPRETVRPCRARRAERHAPPARLLALEADIVALHTGPRRKLELLPPPDTASPAPPPDIRDMPGDPAGAPLAEAPFVIAAGAGIREIDRFLALAASLGATPGASRALCDAGAMPRASQVGASGTVLTGACYLAFGIAGAPQHLQGIGAVPHVIAVNTDLHAAMVARAELAIVADAHPVMLALQRLLEAEAAP